MLKQTDFYLGLTLKILKELKLDMKCYMYADWSLVLHQLEDIIAQVV